MRKIIVSLFLLSNALFCLAQNMQDIPVLPFDTAIVKGILPNGMTYYIQHNDNPRQRAYFYIAQKVGSVQEEENQRGLAHFLEHLCFNGSEHFPGNTLIEYCRLIGVRFGADLNAYTASDRTVYNIDNVPTTDAGNLDSCLLILYDWANALSLETKEIDKERGVIHEEWRMSSGPFMRILERQLPTLMPGSKYGNRLPIGLMSVVDSFKPDVLRTYYKRWYRPDLQGIIIIGDIDVKQMEVKIKKLFGKIPTPKKPSGFCYFDVPDNPQPIIVVDKDKEITTPDISIMFKYDVLPRDLRPTVLSLQTDFLATMLQYMFSYRFDDLKQNPDAPFNDIGLDNGDFILASTKKILNFAFTPKDGKTEEATTDVIREIIRATRYGFTDSEYERAKTQYVSELDQAREVRKQVKTGQLVQECLRNFLDNEAKPPFETAYSIQKQTAQNVPLQVVNSYLQGIVGKIDTNVVILSLYPEKEGVAIPEKNTFSDIMEKVKAEDIKPYVVKTVNATLIDKPLNAGSVKKVIPADKLGYQTLILSNGIKIHYKKTDFDESSILFSAVSKGGTSRLPLTSIDDAEVFNEVLENNGLGKFNSNDLRKALTGRQVSIAPQLSHYTESLHGNSSPKDFRTLMQLIYLYYTELNYDTLNYINVIKAEEQYLENRTANPQSALSDSVTVRLHDNDPRFLPFTSERLKKVSYDGICKIYQDRYGNAGDFNFFFTGNINEDSLRTFAELYLANLPVKKQKAEKYVSDGADLWKGMKDCRFKRKMETPQAILLQLWNGKISYNMKNDVAGELLADLLSDAYLKSVREEHSMAYTIGSNFSLFNNCETGYFLNTSCPVKPEKCDSALLLIDEGLKALAANGPEMTALKKAKEQRLKNYENNLRENNFWQSLEISKVIDGQDQFSGYKETLQNITGKDIKMLLQNKILKQRNRLNVIMLPQ